MKMCHLFLILGVSGSSATMATGDELRTASRWHVLLVRADGVRWQDVFRGADPALLNKPDGGVSNVEAIRPDCWSPDEFASRRRRRCIARKHGVSIGVRDVLAGPAPAPRRCQGRPACKSRPPHHGASAPPGLATPQLL